MRPVSLYLWLIAAVIAVAYIQCNPTADERNESPSEDDLSSKQRAIEKIVANLEERLPRNGLSSLLTALAADMLNDDRFIATENQTRFWILDPSLNASMPFGIGSYPATHYRRKLYHTDTWISVGTSVLNALRQMRSYVMDLCFDEDRQSQGINVGTDKLPFYKDIYLADFSNSTCHQIAIDSHRTSLSISDRTITFSLIKRDDPSKCLSFITDIPRGLERQLYDKLQFEPCEKIEVNNNQKFTIKLTEERLDQLIKTLEFQTAFHSAWTEHCRLVKPGNGADDRICLLKSQHGLSIEDLVKPLLGSHIDNATKSKWNQAVVADAMSVGFPLQINTSYEHTQTLIPTMTDDGRIHFQQHNICDEYCHLKPFEWTSLDMRLSYIFGKDKYHRLDLCAERNSSTTDELYELNRITALRESQRLNCTKLALGKNFGTNETVNFQIIKVDEPDKCLTRLISDKSPESKSNQIIRFRFETCSDIRQKSDQVFQSLRKIFRHSFDFIDMRTKNFLSPMFGLQYLSREDEYKVT